MPGSVSGKLPRFRGDLLTGDEAALRASRVSGPFQAAPHAYAVPADLDDLRALVRWGQQEGVALIPRGGGTGMPGGNLGSGVVVDLVPAFSALDPVDPERRTIRVGAGAVMDRIQEAAGRFGLRLPVVPASSPWCTAGGVVANNAAGPRSFAHGSIRPRVAALEGVDARGERFRLSSPDAYGGGTPSPGRISEDGDSSSEIEERIRSLATELSSTLAFDPDQGIRGWPRVRKNSSGYALDHLLVHGDPLQLLIGSEGTLSVVTHVEFRLEPVPEAQGLALVAVPGSPELEALCRGARQTGAVTCDFLGRRLVELCRLDQDPELGPLGTGAYALALLEVEGSPAGVQAHLQSLKDLAAEGSWPILATTDPDALERLWSLRHRASPLIAQEASRGRISTQFIEDSVVPPDALAAYLEGVDRILADVRFDGVVFGHAGDGNVHVNPLVDVESGDWEIRIREALDRTVNLVRELGGTLAGEHGDGRLRAPLLHRIWPEPLVNAFRQVKETLDPRGILNPGVILPLPGQDPLEFFLPRPRAFP
jgi:FAD/FMN-containing dehydrogenase